MICIRYKNKIQPNNSSKSYLQITLEMYDESRMARIKQLMARHSRPKASSYVDTRPASGMVGQKCSGYVEDASGRLVMLQEDQVTEDYVGPGSYDPNFPANGKSVKISNNVQRIGLLQPNQAPAPGSYSPKAPDTRIQHLITSSEPLPDPKPWLSLNEEHKSWLPKDNTNVSCLHHPRLQARNAMTTHQFVSTTTRELFPCNYVSPGPVKYANQRPPLDFSDASPSPAFNDKIDRFKPLLTFGPSPATYNLPNEFGNAQTKVIQPPMKIKKKEYKQDPDPTTYAEPVIKVKQWKQKSPGFQSKMDRVLYNTNSNPAPDQYNINRKFTDSSNLRKIGKKCYTPGTCWYYLPSKEMPGVGSYSPERNSYPKSGYISTIGHRPLFGKAEDRPLEYRTTHSSLLKKSFNSHYMDITD